MVGGEWGECRSCGGGAVVSRGVVYVAYGDQAREQARLSAKSLKGHHLHLPMRVISDEPFSTVARFPEMPHIYHEDTDPGARLVKLNVDNLSPFDHTLYLDADTRIMRPILWPFELLEAGWEMCIVPCRHQGENAHLHVDEEERATTFAEVDDAIALQGGVIYFRKCEAVHRLFAAWREEWQRYRDQDQAALVRALVRCPVKLFLLGRAYNGGHTIKHYYTYARRRGLQYSPSERQTIDH